jgi:hypothetical protein
MKKAIHKVNQIKTPKTLHKIDKKLKKDVKKEAKKEGKTIAKKPKKVKPTHKSVEGILAHNSKSQLKKKVEKVT